MNEKSAHESCSKPSQPSRASRWTRRGVAQAWCGWTSTYGLVARKASDRESERDRRAGATAPTPATTSGTSRKTAGYFALAASPAATPAHSSRPRDREREGDGDQRGHRDVGDGHVRVGDADRLDRDDRGGDEAGRSSRTRRGRATRRRRRRRRRRRDDHEPGGQVRRLVLPRLERREHVEEQRRVVEPVRVEPAAVDHPPRARDDVLLVRVEQAAERQAVLDPDQPQRRRERRGSRRAAEASSGRESAPRPAALRARRRTALSAAQRARRREARHRRGGRRRPADEHGVDAGPLEREHVVARGRREVGDRELAGRHVGQQVEDPLEVRPRRPRPRAARAGRSPGRSARASGERLLVVDVDDDLQPELVCAPAAAPRGAPRRRAPRRRSGRRRRRRPARPPATRRRGRGSAGRSRRGCRRRGRPDRESLGALLLGRSSRSGVAHERDDRDPVPLGDRLAEASRPGHCA